jgi:monothiol glutaredoxin
MKIIAYLKPTCGWSMGVRAIMKKYGLEYEDRDIINHADQYAEMVEKSGQALSPCVEINGSMLADVSGEEVENYMLSNGLVSENNAEAEAPTNAPCTDEEHEAMRSKTVRFFYLRHLLRSELRHSHTDLARKKVTILLV